ISPQLLDELKNDTGDLEIKLQADGTVINIDPAAASEETKALHYSEADLRWNHNENAMAVEKLSEGIRTFYADQLKLENLLKQLA
ncbi:MAG: hypothetical protein O7F73_15610, partial [Gammaproteobacteria bacterium]|nr:hypothetical protein [Gammaproteobacteria bacterium]